MRVLDLFSGIGGFSLGLERAGMETVAFCEFDKHAQKVLAKHWPNIPIHEDVRELDGNKFRGSVDVVCGGFPCQDLSGAGLQKGFGGERSSLYREMLRIISECRPRYAIFENVTGLLTGEDGRWFAKFLYGLAEIGFDAEWHCISASELSAPHHRDRVWIIAYPSSLQCDGKKVGAQERTQGEIHESGRYCGANDVANTDDIRSKAGLAAKGGPREGKATISEHLSHEIRRETAKQRVGWWSVEPRVGRVANGVQNRAHRLKQLGNSVVSQIPEAIGRAIMQVEGNC